MTRAAFTRGEPDERRQSLIDAARAVLAEHGVAGVSVRAICARAGVSPGLLRHYFAGIDALIAATYVNVGAQVSATLAQARDAAGPDPRARLTAFVIANFRPPVSDPALLATWIGFWSLVKSDAGIARLHGEIYAAYRADVEALLGDCGLAEPRLGAIALTALIDGLWLELCLAPGVFTPEEAIAIAERQIAALLATC